MSLIYLPSFVMHLVHLSCLPIGLDMTQFALSWTLFTQLALPWA